jgi:hypothetical protein
MASLLEKLQKGQGEQEPGEEEGGDEEVGGQ